MAAGPAQVIEFRGPLIQKWVMNEC